jgi:acetate kinase
MALLILNAGSSSLKFSLLDQHDHHVWLQRTIDLTSSAPRPDARASGPHDRSLDGRAPVNRRAQSDTAVERIVAESRAIALTGPRAAAIEGVAHRVVHGGARFTQPVRITPEVRAALTELTPIAPLHNPPSLDVIDAAMAALPEVPHVAVFDTAFHATLSPEARTYPLPYDWSERWGLRRFGFHGLSHAYGARRAAEMIGHSPDGLHVIVAHLGNGASITAVRGGKSVETTMGFTPMEGLMMGTRSGSIDPGLLLYLQRTCGISAEELDHVLNYESGLLGVSGLSSDMRTLNDAAAAGDQRASLAIRMFAHRARQAIGALAVTLGRVDVLVFTGGIGEHSAQTRTAICDGLSCVGLELNEEANVSMRPDAVLSSSRSPGRILVITSREDVTMADAAMSCL